jgi:hypothetical protein
MLVAEGADPLCLPDDARWSYQDFDRRVAWHADFAAVQKALYFHPALSL